MMSERHQDDVRLAEAELQRGDSPTGSQAELDDVKAQLADAKAQLADAGVQLEVSKRREGEAGSTIRPLTGLIDVGTQSPDAAESEAGGGYGAAIPPGGCPHCGQTREELDGFRQQPASAIIPKQVRDELASIIAQELETFRRRQDAMHSAIVGRLDASEIQTLLRQEISCVHAALAEKIDRLHQHRTIPNVAGTDDPVCRQNSHSEGVAEVKQEISSVYDALTDKFDHLHKQIIYHQECAELREQLLRCEADDRAEDEHGDPLGQKIQREFSKLHEVLAGRMDEHHEEHWRVHQASTPLREEHAELRHELSAARRTADEQRSYYEMARLAEEEASMHVGVHKAHRDEHQALADETRMLAECYRSEFTNEEKAVQEARAAGPRTWLVAEELGEHRDEVRRLVVSHEAVSSKLTDVHAVSEQECSRLRQELQQARESMDEYRGQLSTARETESNAQGRMHEAEALAGDRRPSTEAASTYAEIVERLDALGDQAALRQECSDLSEQLARCRTLEQEASVRADERKHQLAALSKAEQEMRARADEHRAQALASTSGASEGVQKEISKLAAMQHKMEEHLFGRAEEFGRLAVLQQECSQLQEHLGKARATEGEARSSLDEHRNLLSSARLSEHEAHLSAAEHRALASEYRSCADDRRLSADSLGRKLELALESERNALATADECRAVADEHKASALQFQARLSAATEGEQEARALLERHKLVTAEAVGKLDEIREGHDAAVAHERVLLELKEELEHSRIAEDEMASMRSHLARMLAEEQEVCSSAWHAEQEAISSDQQCRARLVELNVAVHRAEAEAAGASLAKQELSEMAEMCASVQAKLCQFFNHAELQQECARLAEGMHSATLAERAARSGADAHRRELATAAEAEQEARRAAGEEQALVAECRASAGELRTSLEEQARQLRLEEGVARIARESADHQKSRCDDFMETLASTRDSELDAHAIAENAHRQLRATEAIEQGVREVAEMQSDLGAKMLGGLHRLNSEGFARQGAGPELADIMKMVSRTYLLLAGKESPTCSWGGSPRSPGGPWLSEMQDLQRECAQLTDALSSSHEECQAYNSKLANMANSMPFGLSPDDGALVQHSKLYNECMFLQQQLYHAEEREMTATRRAASPQRACNGGATPRNGAKAADATAACNRPPDFGAGAGMQGQGKQVRGRAAHTNMADSFLLTQSKLLDVVEGLQKQLAPLNKAEELRPDVLGIKMQLAEAAEVVMMQRAEMEHLKTFEKVSQYELRENLVAASTPRGRQIGLNRLTSQEDMSLHVAKFSEECAQFRAIGH